jgi:hypothetical protein
MLLAITTDQVLLALLAIWLIVLVISLLSLWKSRDMLLPFRLFWMAVILFAPVVGLIFYLLFGIKKRPATDLQRSRPS